METLDSSNVAITYPHPYVGPDRSNLAASNIETMIWVDMGAGSSKVSHSDRVSTG